VKRRVLLAVVAALVAACRTVPLWEKPVTPVEAPIVDPARLHRATLDNGLEVLVLEDHRFPTVDLGLAVRSGSAIEGPGEEGLAVFTAELMGRGAGERTAAPRSTSPPPGTRCRSPRPASRATPERCSPFWPTSRSGRASTRTRWRACAPS
jgi:predicted Zn-dependent peptidase